MLEPPLRAGDPRSIDAIAPTDFTDRLREVVPDGPVRKPQLVGDLRAALAIGGEPEHLALAVTQRIGFAPRLGGELRIDRAASSVHAPDRIGEMARRRILQHV